MRMYYEDIYIACMHLHTLICYIYAYMLVGRGRCRRDQHSLHTSAYVFMCDVRLCGSMRRMNVCVANIRLSLDEILLSVCVCVCVFLVKSSISRSVMMVRRESGTEADFEVCVTKETVTEANF